MMTPRKPKEKIQDHAHKHPPNQTQNIYLKPNHKDSTPTTQLLDFRSLSKGKHKLKLSIFKNKYIPNESPHPQQKDIIKSYSSLATINTESRKNINSIRQYLAEKKVLPNSQKDIPNSDKIEPHKKQKREFKLIHQLKKDIALKAQQKIKNSPAQTSPGDANNAIFASSKGKIDLFAQEMQRILDAPQQSPEPPQLERWKLKSYELKETILKSSIKSPVKNQAQQSIVKMEHLPSQLFKSKENPLLLKKQQIEQQHKAPNLSRSFYLAEKVLRQKRDSNPSMDASFRQSKVRAEISISLALQSKQGSRLDLSVFYKQNQGRRINNDKVSNRDKVNAHLQILHSMSNFVYESVKFDEIGEEWEELNFLIYKKFYIERRKVLNFLQKYPMRNPFCIYNAQISSKELIQFMKTEEGISMLGDLKKETAGIKQKLASIYSKFDKSKVGLKINLYEYDNFSHWIIQDLWAQLILSEHNTTHTQQQISTRRCRILQLIFLISELNGKYECSFEDAEIAIAQKQYEQYIKEGKDIYQRYILYKETEESQQFD